MATVLRIYKGKDVEMLTVCGALIGHAINHKTFLISKRATWADPFFDDTKTTIDDAFPDILGIDNAAALRASTQVVLGIQKNALEDLSSFKIQVTEDFKSNKTRRSEIFNLLGFNTHYKDASQGKDQEALVELLFKFKDNMSTTLQTEITDKGTAAALITAIKGYATTLNASNVSQETFKAARKEITADGVTALNSIYNIVISISKISTNFLRKTDPTAAEGFSYAKRLKAINPGGGGGTPPPTP